MVVYDVSPPRRPDDRDDVAAEANAILAVGRALATLDPETRLRVLRWANERFNASAAAEQAPAASSPSARSADSMLSIEGVHAFFEPSLTPHEANDSPHEIAHEDFSDVFDVPPPRGRAELRVVVRNDAPPKVAALGFSELYEAQLTHGESEAPEPMADLFDQPAVVEPDADTAIAACSDEAVEDAPALAEAAAREDQPLDTLVSDFANALRDLTLQLEDATA